MRQKKSGGWLTHVFVFPCLVLFCAMVAASAQAQQQSQQQAQQSSSAQRAGGPATATPAVDMDQALLDLLAVLEEETELATKTKMNVDFVPGMVSVLHGEDLVARGIRNVYEALALIPGVELSKSSDGQLQVIVRGVGKTFSSGKVKFLLNGVPFNATLNAVTTALGIPVELLERIEVIRGPGSAVYGEFASVGVVNIITSKKTGQAFGRYSDDDNYTVGGQVYHQFVKQNLSVGASFSYQDKQGGNVQAGEDILASSAQPSYQNISNSPGPVNDKEQNKVFLFNLDYRDLILNWQLSQRDFGDHFGAANALPENEQVMRRSVTMQSVELAKTWELKPKITSTTKAGWVNFDIDSSQQYLFPVGFAFPLNNPQAGFIDEGVLAAPNYEEDKYYVGADLSVNHLSQHDLLFGVDYSYTQQGETYAERNYRINDNGQMEHIPNGVYIGEDNWLEEDLERRVLSLYAQDQYSISEQWMLTAGLRWDDYDDIGSDVTPRLAVVYQLSDRQTLKAQYAKSFRPPTFLEMYVQNNAVVSGNPELKSEKLDNFELGYVYNDGLSVIRATGFYYDLKDLIVIDTTSRSYINQGEIQARGLELELVKQLWEQIKVDGNISYTHADYEDGQQIPGVAQVTANLGLFYQPRKNSLLSVQYRYVGERQRQVNDAREDLAAYHIVDLTWNQFNLLLRGLTVRLGVKNLFDSDVIYPSSLVRAPDGGVRPGYEGDYPQTGREIVLQSSYDF